MAAIAPESTAVHEVRQRRLRYTGSLIVRRPALVDSVPGDAYQILGVQPGSSDETIAAAYRALARRHHPDVVGEAGTSRMIRLNAAFRRIRTAALRAEYERERRESGIGQPRWTRESDGTSGAGPAPGRPSGSKLAFGRHLGWSIGEIARVDPGYLEWLEDRPEGRAYLAEIDRMLREVGFRTRDTGQRAHDRRPRFSTR